MERLGYRPGLDGLRGVAILLVLFGHFDVPPLDAGGLAGVTLFFVLSGFLITSLLLKERDASGTVALGRFYLRRARRLFPALVAVLAVSAFFLPWAKLQPVAFYYGNWARVGGEPQVLGFLNHTWSLAIEEQFYLLWPLVMLLAPRQAKRVAVVGIGIAVGLRLLIWQGPEHSAFVYNATVTRMDALLAGCLLAMSRWRSQFLWVPLLALAGLTMVKDADTSFTYEYAIALAMLLSVFAVGAAVTHQGALTNRVLVWFGKRSYGLYLWHGVLVFGWDPDGWWAKAGVFALSLVITEMSWWGVERWWLVRPSAGTVNSRR